MSTPVSEAPFVFRGLPSFLVGTLLLAGVVTVPLQLLWDPMGYLFWVLWPALMVALLVGRSVAFAQRKCGSCLRRIRTGQTVCHKCGAACNVERV